MFCDVQLQILVACGPRQMMLVFPLAVRLL